MVIVFDYDGTLHDTAKLYGSAFRRAYADLVRDSFAPEHYYSDSYMARYLGMSPPEMWEAFMPELPEDVWKKASVKVREGMISGIEEGKAVLYEGVADMLEELKRRGFRMVILSNCYHEYLEAHRRHFGLDRWFCGYYCSEDWKFAPKEEIMKGIMRDYPGEAFIVIGDRDSDLRAGTANNAPVIGCAYGFGTEEELKMFDAIAYDPAEIPGIIQMLLKGKKMEKKLRLSCADCGVVNCETRDKEYPEFCLTTGLSSETIQKVRALYEEEENRKVSIVSAEIENEFYLRYTRVQELVEFAKRMDYHKIGIATCVGLIGESRILAKILRKNGFEVYCAACKIGSFDKSSVGVAEKDMVNTGPVMCNPVMQAEVLNAAETDLNVVMGLCVGHDSLFYKYSEALVTTLVAKDRVLAHNPAGALYQTGSYYRKLMTDDIE